MKDTDSYSKTPSMRNQDKGPKERDQQGGSERNPKGWAVHANTYETYKNDQSAGNTGPNTTNPQK